MPRRQISILAGASGAGKTTLLMQAIQKWVKGEEFPISFDATKCSYVVADRTREEVEIRARELRLEIDIYGIVDDKEFRRELLQDAGKALDEVLRRVQPGYDLLIIDPIMLFIEGNALDYRRVAMSLICLNRIARHKNITIVGTHHASKARTDYSFRRAQDRILGTAAFQGYSGTQMILIDPAEDDSGGLHTLVMVPHMSPQTEVQMIRGSGGWFEIVEGASAPLLQSIEDGTELSTGELRKIGEALGISERNLYRQLGKFIKDGDLVKVGHGKYLKSRVS